MRTEHIFRHNFFISSPISIELPLIRIVEKTILMSGGSIVFGEEIRILVF